MSSRSKTRFTAISGGHDRELFSVGDLRNGDLMVVLKGGSHSEVYGGNHKKIEERFSVHRSLNSTSGNYTFKNTLKLEGERDFDAVQIVSPVEDKLVAILYAKTVQNLNYDKYLVKSRPKDTFISINNRDIGSMLMFYQVLVSNFEISSDILTQTSMNSRQVKFSHFYLTILSGYFMVPSIPQSDLIHFITSHPRFEKNQPAIPIPIQIPGMLESEIPERAAMMSMLLSRATMHRHSNLAFAEGTTMSPQSVSELGGLLGMWFKDRP